ncbi:hypothetical protein PVAND_006913 [Polypedilum vanderplanki]|uniref:Uncharacterized protein n=1 Tax=Polypedilum vanderplanki TaxID=319348 RepID=A0A9J6C5M0_POLVA|nr:hypothetical protein PVAND_006913 [Polypedilum vanderplanki]
MSEDEKRGSLKRRAENNDNSEVQSKVIKASSSTPSENENSDEYEEKQARDEGRKNIDEAIKTLDRLQYELNMNNILLESPEPSDHDTPPESEDEEHHQEEMLSQAHALGFAACIRETFRFLDSCGINKDDPIYKQLKNRFVGMTN